jgi:alanyl-tRNA synthetase
MLTTNEIRSRFLSFFKTNSHSIVRSSSLLPHNDPTLMFTNAGMVQFKNIFTGVEKADFTRAASSQKCVRAGGKHNDLDNVGYTARHHTFFEMLGNFSFGDYFKEEAIEFAWNFLVKDLGLPKEKLYVTVYHTDDQAAAIWRKVAGFSDERIIRISTNDNFWSMGDTGPCGPCSEIFYDHGESIPGGLPGTPEEDGDRYIEIWNIVFMQYEQLATGERINLPKPSIDTGMGLERISAVMQGVHDNYDIDLFQNLIKASESITKVQASGEKLVSHRVIADHLRSSCFLIADGISPSNEGRGYVLRRIMRRAMRHVHQLGYKDLLMHQMVPALVHEMGQAYPELKRAESLMIQILQQEENKFRNTLDTGMKLLGSELVNVPGKVLPGEMAFKLYDTYGFPLDLTKDILKGKGMIVDDAGFEQAMQKQKELARASWVGSGEHGTEKLWFELQSKCGNTEFIGYDCTSAQGVVVAIVNNGEQADKIDGIGSKASIITNQTPFYGESGGQLGDHGQIIGTNCVLDVVDTKKHCGLHVHTCVLVSGSLKVNEHVQMDVNEVRRNKLRANHSATHLLHSVLRKQLGEHVTQKGSLVAEDRLRFDITHNKPISADEIYKIETLVNAVIVANQPVNTMLMNLEEAVNIGAMALFGEKYDSEVRVITMGHENFSIELCGGTHVKSVGDIGLFKIISESSIASGVRRIEAVTGLAALEYVQNNEAKLKNIASIVHSNDSEVVSRVSELVSQAKEQERTINELKKSIIIKELSSQLPKDAGDHRLLVYGYTNADSRILREVVDTIRNHNHNTVTVITNTSEGKVGAIIALSDDLVKAGLSAAELAKIFATAINGSGGGKPELAQVGGSNAGLLDNAMDIIKATLSAGK